MAVGRRWGALRSSLLLAFAVVLGAWVVGVADVLLVAKPRPEDAVVVWFASRDLSPGVAIGEDDIHGVAMPLRMVPDGAFLSPQHLLGRLPHERVLAHELLRAERLWHPDVGRGLNAIIPRDLRAITVHVPDGASLMALFYFGLPVEIKAEGASEWARATPARTLGAHELPSPKSTRPVARVFVTLLIRAADAEAIASLAWVDRVNLFFPRCDFAFYLPHYQPDVVDCDGGSALIARLRMPDIRRYLETPLPGFDDESCRGFHVTEGGVRQLAFFDAAGLPCVPPM
jgi:hypothetical protein